MRNRPFKFSQNWLFNHMTSQIVLNAQVFCPINYTANCIFVGSKWSFV